MNDGYGKYKLTAEEKRAYMDAAEKIIGRRPAESDVDMIYVAAVRALEQARNSLVERSYNVRCRILPEDASDAMLKMPHSVVFSDQVPDANVMPETDGAHTAVVIRIMQEYLLYEYGWSMETTEDGYPWSIIIEAASRHDLSENVIGDLADNRIDHLEWKAVQEGRYQHWLSQLDLKLVFKQQVSKLLAEFEEKSNVTGRALYLADKIAALFSLMSYELSGIEPYLMMEDDSISERDKKEMKYTHPDALPGFKYPTLELWACDFFVTRELFKVGRDDDSGWFFTKLVVMGIVLTRGQFFDW